MCSDISTKLINGTCNRSGGVCMCECAREARELTITACGMMDVNQTSPHCYVHTVLNDNLIHLISSAQCMQMSRKTYFQFCTVLTLYSPWYCKDNMDTYASNNAYQKVCPDYFKPTKTFEFIISRRERVGNAFVGDGFML